MSEPTYLIRVDHEPGEVALPFAARVFRLADDTHAVTRFGTTAEEAVKSAQAWIRAEHGPKLPGRELYAAESGEIMVGESVRVLRQP